MLRSGKHRLSLKYQRPAKRRNQSSGPSAASAVEAAEQLSDSQAASPFQTVQRILHRAGEEQLHTTLGSLLQDTEPWKRLEAAYSPFFKEIAHAIIGRDDIPLPPAKEYALVFRFACHPTFEEDRENFTQRIIDYITAQDKERPREVYAPATEVVDAVQRAWRTNYVGNYQVLLQTAVNDMYYKSSMKPYGNFCAIIQGSGTGKSRLVDELSRSVFAIPITLRPSDDKSGFPLGDFANGLPLVNFFCGFDSEPALYVQRRYLLFLLKVIAFANRWIDRQTTSGTKLAAEWREYIGPPQSKQRIAMYSEAIDVDTPLEGFENILAESVQFDTIQNQVREFVNSVSKKIKPAGTDFEPAILFYFDEAHHLTKTTVTVGLPGRTAYQCLCKAFTYMTKTPVFALFLSTYSRLSESVPSARDFWSARPLSTETNEGNDNMNAPFVELPFDAWKQPSLVTEGTHSPEEICSLKFMARFGRPLFWTLLEHSNSTDEDEDEIMAYAMRKLELHLEDPTRGKFPDYPLHQLIPALALRVDLTFESNRHEAVLLEGLLVASSMRIVYSVPQHRQYLRGGYPSEPFLAEAAARAIFKHCRISAFGRDERMKRTEENVDQIIKKYKHDIPSAVLAWLERGLIDKGTRGELVARILCTLAHDIAILTNPSFPGISLDDKVSFSRMVPVVDFLSALISEKHIELVLNAKPRPGTSEKRQTLEEAFKGAFIHFTHFVKAGNKQTFTDEAFCLLFIRGAAIQGDPDMEAADLAFPVWMRRHDDDKPNRWNMTGLWIRINRRVGKVRIHIDVQKTFQFFTRRKSEGHEALPYITIDLELGVLATEQKSAGKAKSKRKTKETRGAKESKAKGKGKGRAAKESKAEGKGKERAAEAEEERASTPSGVAVTSAEHEKDLAGVHPCYSITITGCSKRVYNVIGDFSYSVLLANKDILAEHPRNGKCLDAIRRMKPYWVSQSSYSWATVKNRSRLGAIITKEDEEAEEIPYGGDDTDEGSDGVEIDD